MFEFLKPLLALFNPTLKLEQRQHILSRDLVALDQDLQKVVDAILTEKVRFLEKLDALDGANKAAVRKPAPVARPGLRAAQKQTSSTADAVAAKALRARTSKLETQCHSAFAELADLARQRGDEVAQLRSRLEAVAVPELSAELGQNLEEIAQALIIQKSQISALRLKAITTATELHQACTAGQAPATPPATVAAPTGRAA
ncbi:hypothetical protein [Thalassobius sp. Cn5-15]|uniref:hypothetical protein n=1 Tax=Thalassobius sp. Cn5-15 TaxID=2917763 RepID=UPI001EF1B47A|nr:hypothetical protein [Thalassobius sp. Cn5-15]MCG7493262.1 hypothetical protein [Thalassobius sp. Cn5-15]